MTSNINMLHYSDIQYSRKTVSWLNGTQSLAILGTFNKFPDVFLQAFEIVVDSWKFSILLLYIYEMTDQYFWFQVQMNNSSSNWNTPY